MHVDRGERVLGLGVDVPVGDRLPDQPLDEGPPLDEAATGLLPYPEQASRQIWEGHSPAPFDLS